MRYAIGDVHGEVKALEGLVDEVRKRDFAAEFYFVGDFIDRGPESKAVVEMVIDLGGRACRGNHDDVFDLIASGLSETATGGPYEVAQQTVWFLQYGMAGTLASYGVNGELLYQLTDAIQDNVNVVTSQADMFADDEDSDADEKCAVKCQSLLEEIRSCFPAMHTTFFRNLPSVLELEDFFLVHAHLPYNADGRFADLIKTLPELRQDAIWGRFDWAEINRPKLWGKFGIFGHTPTKHYGKAGEIVKGESMALIDTGATFGFGLTAYCVENGETLSVDKDGKLRT